MSAIPMLDEEEAYLAAILDDPTGIELAEFCWIDETPGKTDPCFRVWDYQWTWYHNTETYQIDQAGRSLGKSMGIQMRGFAFPFNYPGMEMLITAPELNHLGPVVDKIEQRFLTCRLGREMLPARKGGGIKHQPQFQATFINGSVIMGRLPNRDGRGVKGQHPLVIEADEMQDYPRQGWIELIETMKSGVPGAQWRCHGVSRGVRDKYYDMTQGEGDVPFFVHRYMAMHRPMWTAEERKSKIAMYGGSRDNPDYKRNIYGEHGDVTNPVFVLARLMACVRINESTWATEYNEKIYNRIKIEGERLNHVPLESLITFPQSHLKSTYTSYWAGMDIGFTNDPTELLIFGQCRIKDKDVLRLLTRIHLMRVSAPDQEKVIEMVVDFYGDRLRALAMDKTGNGLPVWQHMEHSSTPEKYRSVVRGYGFSEKKPVEFDDRPLVGREKPEDAVIVKNAIEYATDHLRSYVDDGRLELPYDKELLMEYQGQNVMYARDESDLKRGSKSRYGGGSFHTLDASKLMVAAKELEAIEAQLAWQKPAEVLDAFGF